MMSRYQQLVIAAERATGRREALEILHELARLRRLEQALRRDA